MGNKMRVDFWHFKERREMIQYINFEFDHESFNFQISYEPKEDVENPWVLYYWRKDR